MAGFYGSALLYVLVSTCMVAFFCQAARPTDRQTGGSSTDAQEPYFMDVDGSSEETRFIPGTDTDEPMDVDKEENFAYIRDEMDMGENSQSQSQDGNYETGALSQEADKMDEEEYDQSENGPAEKDSFLFGHDFGHSILRDIPRVDGRSDRQSSRLAEMRAKLADPLFNLETTPHPDVCNFPFDVDANAKKIVICTWNLQKFGSNYYEEEHLSKNRKRSKDWEKLALGNLKGMPRLMPVVLELRLCDVILIQEYWDSEGDLGAARWLVNMMDSKEYDMELSKPLGQDVHKEYYTFIYRKTKVELIGCQLFPDEDYEFFARPPHFCNFSVRQEKRSPEGGCLKQFVLGNIHTKPKNAVQELKNLKIAFDWALEAFRPVTNVMIMGDYNAGRGFVKPKEWEAIPIYTERQTYSWFVPHDLPTMVYPRKERDRLVPQAHDRIVSRGHEFERCAISETASVGQYPHTECCFQGLTQQQEITISDHRLVRVEFRI